MKKVIFLFLLFFFSLLIFCQNQQQLDSLEKMLDQPQLSDIDKALTLTRLIYHYSAFDSTKTAQYFEILLPIAQKLGADTLIIEGYIDYAWLLMDKGHYEKSEALFQQGLSLAKKIKNQKLKSAIFNGLGNVAQEQGKYSQSLRYFQETLKIEESLHNTSNIGTIYGNMGIIYYRQEDYEKALEYYQKNLEIKIEINQKKQLYNTFYNLGEVYIQIKEYDKALNNFKKGIQNSEENNSKRGLALNYWGLGELHIALEDYDKAFEYLEKSHLLFEELGDTPYLSQVKVLIGQIYYQQNKYNKAIPYLKDAVKIAQEVGSPVPIKDAYELLFLVYQQMKNYPEALKNHILFMEMKDSLFNEENTKKLTQLEAEYHFSKKEDSLKMRQERERANFEKSQEVNNLKQGMTFIGLGLASLLVIILAIFFWDKQKSNHKLKDVNERLITSNKEIQITSEEVRTINESLQKTLKIVQEQKDDITESISYAQRIQYAILPNQHKFERLFSDSFVFFKPRDVVSGDFYFLEEVENKIILATVDCTGHGVPGAFMSLIGNNLLIEIIINQRITDVNKILEKLHLGIRSILRQQETQNKDGMDAALVMIDKQNKTLEFAGAKSPIACIQNNDLKFIKGDNIYIGGIQTERERIFTKHHISLEVPTSIYLFSDGVQDQFGGKRGKKFTPKRLRSLLFENHQKSMMAQKESLQQTIENWQSEANEQQTDDMLLIGIKI